MKIIVNKDEFDEIFKNTEGLNLIHGFTLNSIFELNEPGHLITSLISTSLNTPFDMILIISMTVDERIFGEIKYLYYDVKFIHTSFVLSKSFVGS